MPAGPDFEHLPGMGQDPAQNLNIKPAAPDLEGSVIGESKVLIFLWLVQRHARL
jgi:hypothetical protein